MIVRTWSARATESGAKRYTAFFESTLLPELRTLEGFTGALLLSRDQEDDVELTTHTFWASVTAIRQFAGNDLERAVVEPEAHACLRDYDPTVVHRHVLVGTTPRAAE